MVEMLASQVIGISNQQKKINSPHLSHYSYLIQLYFYCPLWILVIYPIFFQYFAANEFCLFQWH